VIVFNFTQFARFRNRIFDILCHLKKNNWGDCKQRKKF